MDPLEETVLLLKELNLTAKKQLEIKGLEFALEPLRYITRKLRTGEALPVTDAYYQPLAPAEIWSITFVNPAGYVWIAIAQSIDVSQNGVLEFTAMVDDRIIPVMYVPRLTSHDIIWTQMIPFGHIIKESTLITYVNHDIANQWVSVVSMGIYLRKDVWEKDSALMDEAAEKYVHPHPLPPQLPPR